MSHSPTPAPNPQDELKKQVASAAIAAILPQIAANDILGIGTGSTANFFIDMLAEHKHRFLACVASSEASARRLREHGIEVRDLNNISEARFYIDGADEINPDLHLIKGGGAALTREKIVAACSREFICIADESKWVATLGRFPLPVEVIPMAREHVARQLVKLGGRPVLRRAVITDNGGELLDVYDWQISDALDMEQKINQITGVIANGIFAHRPADLVLLGTKDGVRKIRANR